MVIKPVQDEFVFEDDDIVTLRGQNGWVNVGPWAIWIRRYKAEEQCKGQLVIQVCPRNMEGKELVELSWNEVNCREAGGVDPDEDIE